MSSTGRKIRRRYRSTSEKGGLKYACCSSPAAETFFNGSRLGFYSIAEYRAARVMRAY
jgi:hypothetical protein